MRIIRNRKRLESKNYIHHFTWADSPGSGFAFDCDEQGRVDETKMNPDASRNYKGCLSGSMQGRTIVDQGVRCETHRYTSPAIGLCNECGEEVVLQGFTNTCPRCHTDYNMSGQQLAPRCQWGEETGESVSDILAVDGEANWLD